MIKQEELEEAIAQCQGVINPNSNTCLKLASYLTIRDHMFGNKKEERGEMPQSSYSFSNGNTINMNGRSEFTNTVNGKSVDSVLGVVNELMETLHVLNPRLYDSVIMKLEEAD